MAKQSLKTIQQLDEDYNPIVFQGYVPDQVDYNTAILANSIARKDEAVTKAKWLSL